MTVSDKKAADPAPRMLGLLLVDGFALLSYASVIEPFRAANELARADLYRWTHISVDGRPVSASNGAMVVADAKVGAATACDMLLVFAGGDPSVFRDAPTFGWLRRLASRGVAIAGVSGGPYLLARAGLLDGYRATIHWEHAAAFRDAFPDVALDTGLYVVDRKRMTCAGGTAGLDLALDLIERDHGAALAMRVGEWFIRTETRGPERPQRSSLADRFGVKDARVLRALATMESSLEEPVEREALAGVAGVSLRHLERLFVQTLGATVQDIYRRIRLDRAQQLLRATALSVTEVGAICGFVSSSHFSRAFKTEFGIAPQQLRRAPSNIKTFDDHGAAMI